MHLTVRLNSLNDPNANPVKNFLTSTNDVFEHAIQDVRDGDMIVMAIRNDVSRNDRSIGISFRRRDQLCDDVI
jgi:hypothetical protein